MKKAIGWPAAWALFWLGHFVSRVFCRFDALAFMYPTYSRLMCTSADVQDWAGLSGPWSRRMGR